MANSTPAVLSGLLEPRVFWNGPLKADRVHLPSVAAVLDISQRTSKRTRGNAGRRRRGGVRYGRSPGTVARGAREPGREDAGQSSVGKIRAALCPIVPSAQSSLI